MKEKYGFVYIWYDKKHKRFYIGSHWGIETDSYICSSNWMRASYNRRPEDFKRRILSRVYDRKKTLLEEFRWLSMIDEKDLGKRYYNLRQHQWGHWSTDVNSIKTVGEKISASPNRNSNISKAHTGKIMKESTKEKLRQVNLGKKLSEETKAKIKASHNRDYSDPIFLAKMSAAAKNRSPEHRRKIGENTKRLQAEGKIGMLGRKHSDETKKKMSETQRHNATINTNKNNTLLRR